jgi:hypothetical protein
VHFEDLTPYEYLGNREPNTFNIGWLDEHHAFPIGETPNELQKRLLRLCIKPVNRARGWQECPFCTELYPIEVEADGQTIALGDGEIRIEGKDHRRYAAPNLIYHYVDKHRYRPPDEFQNAVLDSSQL